MDLNFILHGLPKFEENIKLSPARYNEQGVQDHAQVASQTPAGKLQRPGRLRGSRRVLEASLREERESDGSLFGLPRKAGKFQASHYPKAHQVAQKYMDDHGMEYRPVSNYVKVDPERATRIAQAYEQMIHQPDHPEVKRAYEALVRETLKQYEYTVKHGGMTYEFQPLDQDPYHGNPREMTEDVRNNHHMWVYPTDAGFGTGESVLDGNPLLAKTNITWKGKPTCVNDIFRAVHDYFGHVKEGVGFRADGEENAWRAHRSMFSPEARRALTSETRGQNSWVNYGPHGAHNQTAKQDTTRYADQKTGLLPQWAVDEGGDDY